MTLEEAKGLSYKQTVYHKTKKNKDGTPMRAKVLSVKTWKTRPEQVRVSVKRGLRDFALFDETVIGELCLREEDCE